MVGRDFKPDERIRIIPKADYGAAVNAPGTGADLLQWGDGVLRWGDYLLLWGELVPLPGIRRWAERREVTISQESAAGTIVQGTRIIFRIRKTRGVEPESIIRDRHGVEYAMIGGALERGGAPQKMASKFYELHCERRTRAAAV